MGALAHWERGGTVKVGDMVRLNRCSEMHEQSTVGLLLDIIDRENAAAQQLCFVMWPGWRDDAQLPQLCWILDLDVVSDVL